MAADRSTSTVIPLTPRGEEAPSYRQPPANVEAEQQLLGAILVNNEAMHRVTGFLQPEHFFEPVHSRIFESVKTAIDRGQIASPVTLKTFLERDEALIAAGGVQYLARLAASATSIIHAETHGRIIHDLYLRRQLVLIGEDIHNTAYEVHDLTTATTQIEQAEQKLFDLAENGQPEGGFKAFSRSLAEAITSIESAHKRDGRLTGVTTGLKDLDAQLGGLHRSDLIVLAGRPSMGKTALATNIAFNAARAYRPATEDHPAEGAVVGFFSLEMSAEQLAGRILAEQTEMSAEKLRRGQLSAREFDRLVEVSQELERIPLFIDDTPSISIANLRARARRLKRTEGLGLVVVDYLQLMRSASQRAQDNRVLEISEITQGLKALAKELDVPVLAAAQVSRKAEEREDKRPQLADLRESGTIEQDADVVMFVFREEYYLERAKPADDSDKFLKWRDRMERVHNLAELLIGKQRHGPTGVVNLHFRREFTKFSDHIDDAHLPDGPR